MRIRRTRAAAGIAVAVGGGNIDAVGQIGKLPIRRGAVVVRGRGLFAESHVVAAVVAEDRRE